jgi:hypothetical protein
MTTFFEHQRASYKRNYLRNLIALASSDGHLDEKEKALIHKIGLKRGLKMWQIEELLHDSSTYEVFLPESLPNRMNLLYDIMQIIYADGEVSEEEMRFTENILHAFGLPVVLVSHLLELFRSDVPSQEEWLTFVEQSKEMMLVQHVSS